MREPGSGSTSSSRGHNAIQGASASSVDARLIGAAASGGRSSRSGLALAALAWALLALWAASPWGRYLDHGDWTQAGLVGALCAAVPGGAVPAALYAAGWVLMLAAMMLPTALPVLLSSSADDGAAARRRAAGGAGGRGLSRGLGGFRAGRASRPTAAVAAAVRRSAWLTFNGWALGAAVLAVAGAFQFSGLKRRCLDRCRTPLGLVMARWRGRGRRARPGGSGWRTGPSASAAAGR